MSQSQRSWSLDPFRLEKDLAYFLVIDLAFSNVPEHSLYSSMHNHFLHSDRKVVARWPGTEKSEVNIQKSSSPAFLPIFFIRLHFAVAPVIS